MFNLRKIKALKCHTWELSYEFLHDLHHGQKNNEQIMEKKGNQYGITILNIASGNNHCKKT